MNKETYAINIIIDSVLALVKDKLTNNFIINTNRESIKVLILMKAHFEINNL